MRVVAKLRPPAGTPEQGWHARAAEEVAATTGVPLRVSSAPYVVAEAPDLEAARQLIERLRASPHVESAYIKPEPGLPGAEA